MIDASSSTTTGRLSLSMPCSSRSSGSGRRRRRVSMLDRQNEWLEAKEKKLQAARAIKEQCEVEVRHGDED